jgi:hypothetical protein
LTLSDWLHDPDSACSLEFFDEDAVLAWQVVSGRKEIIRIGLLDFAFTVEHLFVSLKVLNHQIFSCELIVVTEMINLLMRLKMVVIEDVIDLVALYPKNIPIITFSLLVALLPKRVKHTVPESRLELDMRWMLRVVFFLDVLAEVLGHFFLTI